MLRSLAKLKNSQFLSIRRLSACSFFFSIWIVWACTDSSILTPSENNSSGEFSVAIKLSKAAAASISRAEVVISASDMTEIRQYLTISGNIVSGTVRDIPAGSNRFFTLNGYDASGTLTYTGSSVAEVIPGEDITVRITLKRLSQAPDNTTNGVFFEFNGTGNGTTGSITLDHGVYTVQVDKPSSDAISLELLDANTGQKILFNWSDLMSLEGRNQTSIGKSFVIANDGDYIINIRGSSGLGAWSMLIETATTQTLGTSGLRFQGEGNGTTGVITLESGAHTVQVDKPSSDAISLELLDANTGQKILFNWSDLMSLEGRNQTSIGKSFVIANDGDYIINISGSSGFGAWEMIIR